MEKIAKAKRQTKGSSLSRSGKRKSELKNRKGSQVRTVDETWFTDLLNQAQAIVTSKEMLKVRTDEYLKPMLVEIGTWNSKGAKPETIIATV